MNEIIKTEEDSIISTDLFLNIQNFNISGEISQINPPTFPEMHELKLNEMSFFKVEQLLYDSDYPRREAFENVLRSLDNNSFNLVYVLTGTKKGVELCIGVVKNKNAVDSTLSTSNYGDMIRNIFEGNFNGSKLQKLRGNNLTDTIINRTDTYSSAGMIHGIPSMNEETQNGDNDFQGIDRLINSMLGKNWRLVVVCEPVKKSTIREIQNRVYEIYDRLAAISKLSMQSSSNSGSSYTEGENSSDTRGQSTGYSDSQSHTESKSKTSNSETRSTNSGTSSSHTSGTSRSKTVNGGTSTSWSMEITNKKAAETMKYIDEELLKRLNVGLSKGIYSTSVYYMADNPSSANKLKSCLMSLFQGDGSTFSPLVNRALNLESVSEFNVLKTFQNHVEISDGIDPDIALLHSRPLEDNLIYLSTLLTAKEISLYTGLPQTEVPGIILNTGVNFGVNEDINSEDEQICLGNMIQKGRELEEVPLHISHKILSKHTFIAGVTGSGKTTTCHRILDEIHNAGIPFMIIEPAKTEYRTLINKYRNLVVFTLGNESVAPFRLNPFELIEGEIISSHIDMLKATFTSAFPMEASMPQILEEAIYKCYSDKGWNIITNKNRKYGNNAWSIPESMPILSELLENLKIVTKEKEFGDRLQSEYIGSLVSRLSNLTVGSKGCMLNCRKSVDLHYLANHNIILELEDLKSPEDKALIMGLVLSGISAAIRKEHKENNEYRHITLVEEAHRLLTKPDFSDTGARKAAVETFTDLLAEVRKYGEGLIIVDQIPNKLATEVLKNTNTKIIHKILARDDKEVVGDTMLMDDKQKEFLSALNVGEAIVFTENTDKPVHVAVKCISDTSEEEISDETVKQRFDKKRKSDLSSCYSDLAVREYMDDFYVIINKLRCMEEHNDLRISFLSVINGISESTGMKINAVWNEFICRALDEAAIPADERKEALLKFFSADYSDSAFTVYKLGIDDLKYFGGF